LYKTNEFGKIKMTVKTLTLTIMDGMFTIHRLPPNANIPKQVLTCPVYSITHSKEELSIIVPERVDVPSEKSESGWVILRINGPLDLGLVGVMAGISGTLAKAGVSLFAISTFDTDYILIKEENVKKAREALTAKGYKVVKPRTRTGEEKKGGITANAIMLLETQIPTIKNLLVEKIGSAGTAALRNDATFSAALGSTYEFMPTPVRILIPRQMFVDFCLLNRNMLLPPITIPDEKKPKTDAKPKGGKK
jgi:hypothetical protein